MPGPSSDDVKPVSIVRTHGSVTNPQALAGGERRHRHDRGARRPPGHHRARLRPGGRRDAVRHRGAPTLPPPRPPRTTCASPRARRCRSSTRTRPRRSLAPPTAGDSNVKVATVAPFYVGSPITIGAAPDAETRNVTAVGTAAAPNTTLVLPAAAGDGERQRRQRHRLHRRQPADGRHGLRRHEADATITAVGTAAGAPTTVVYPAERGRDQRQGRQRGRLRGRPASADRHRRRYAEVRTVSSVGTPATTSRLFARGAAGDTNVKVTSVAGSTAGAEIDIDPGPNQDHVTITSVGTAGTNSTVAAANVTSGPARPVADRRELDLERRRREHHHPGRHDLSCARPSTSPTRRRSRAPSSGQRRRRTHDLRQRHPGVRPRRAPTTPGRPRRSPTSGRCSSPGTNVIAIAPFNSGSAGSLIAVAQLDGDAHRHRRAWKALPGTLGVTAGRAGTRPGSTTRRGRPPTSPAPTGSRRGTSTSPSRPDRPRCGWRASPASSPVTRSRSASARTRRPRSIQTVGTAGA